MIDPPPARLAPSPLGARVAVALLLVASLLATWRAGSPGAAADDAADPYAAVLPARRAAVAARTDGRLSRYTFDVALDPAASTIGGTAAVVFRNNADVPLAEAWFRLFPNAAYYGDGGTAVRDVTVDGAAATSTFAVRDTAMRAPFAASLAPGSTATIRFGFTTTVPTDSAGSFGILSHATGPGTWVLSDWHPVLAVWEAGSGWSLPAPTEAGDPTYAEAALYDVTIQAPDSLRLVLPGAVVEDVAADGIRRQRAVAGPARDFTLVADDDFVTDERTVDGTTITLHANPGRDPAVRQGILDAAAAALAFDNATLGPYPFARLEIADVPLEASLGVSWTGLIFLDGPGMLGRAVTADSETVVAHEVSHEWWGATVGADTNAHPFMAEGLATISALLTQERTAGPDVAGQQFDRWVVGPTAALLRAGDVAVDRPAAPGDDQDARAWAAYGKASLAFTAIREEIGDDAFLAGLRGFAERWQFGIAGPADLRAAWEQASGRDLGDLWAHWFDRAELTQAELEAVAAAYPGKAPSGPGPGGTPQPGAAMPSRPAA